MKPVVKIGIIAALGAAAIFFLTRTATAKTPQASTSRGSVLGPALSALGQGAKKLVKKIITPTAGIGTAATGTGVAGTSAAGSAAVIPAAATVPTAAPVTSAAAGAGTAGAALAPVGGLLAAAGLIILNLYVMFHKRPPSEVERWVRNTPEGRAWENNLRVTSSQAQALPLWHKLGLKAPWE